MKFFLDTANLEELRKGADLGVVDGDVSAAVVSTEAGKEGIRADKGLDQFLKDWGKVFQEVPAGG